MSDSRVSDDVVAWFDPRAAIAWIDAELHELGHSRVGAPEPVRMRPWSVVWRISVGGMAPLWFKANGGDTRYEAALAKALGAWLPDQVIVPLAVETDRGWQLSPHGGEVLRGQTAGADLRQWETFVRDYALMQQALAERVGELLAIGVPDQSPHRLPGHLRDLLESPDVRLSDASRHRLVSRLAEYEQRCAELAGGPVAVSLNHDDLHDANVVARGGGGFAFFDWGDASIAHPFTTLLVTLRSAASRFDLPADDFRLARVRDAYLEPFTVGLDLDDLRTIARIACWTGEVGRALAWSRALAAAGFAERERFGDPVAGWIEELLRHGSL